MKRAVLGCLVCVGLIVAAMGGMGGEFGEAFAQQPVPGVLRAPAPLMPAPAAVVGSELIVVPSPVTEKGQILTVIDPKLRVMSVYRVDLATGKITLQSVRNIHWDLQIREMNSDKPSTHEVQSMLEQN